MSVINALREKRNHLIAQATALVKPEMTQETRSQIDAIYADADALKGDIDRAQRSLDLEAELRSSVALPASELAAASSSNPEDASKAAYKSAFRNYLRGGVSALSNEERRSLSEGRNTLSSEQRALTGASGANGAFLIETDLQKSIREALKEFGGMRKVATIWQTAQGNPVTLPLNNDTANPGKRLNATTVPGTVDELDLTFNQVTFGTWTYTTQKITISNELLRDAAFDLEAFIKKAFVTRIGRIQNTEFTNGTGTTMPNGLVTNTPAGVTAATGGATSVTYNNLVDTIHALDPAYRQLNAKFMFHDTTLAAIRKLTDNYGRPLLGLGINGGDPDSILGYSYVINQDMPVMAANAKSILFGDYSEAYTIRDVGDLSIVRLDELGMLSNQTIFVGFTAADGQYVNAGTPSTVAFVNSAT